MVITCSNCTTSLQLNDAKVPARPFTVRCPKCQSVINAQPPNTMAATTAAHDSAAPAQPSEPTRYEAAMPAPLFEAEDVQVSLMKSEAGDTNGGVHPAATPPSAGVTDTNELARMLAALLQRSSGTNENQRNASRLAWERRRALVCIGELSQRETIARALLKSDYQTFVAEDLTQALERMREESMDVVVLDQDFDQMEQGAAYVTREVNALRPVERRRLFFVRLHPSSRTGDPHAAFINNVNLIVNSADIENMPRALERALRDFNDLYSNLNRALNVAAL